MDRPPIRYQIPGADGWRTAVDWPPPQAQLTSFALSADGVLRPDEGIPGLRKYLYLPADSGQPSNMNTPDMPSILTWNTEPFETAFEFAGPIELTLEATITAPDTSWIAVLYDVSQEGSPRQSQPDGFARVSPLLMRLRAPQARRFYFA
jgi:predicted acyl esterase